MNTYATIYVSGVLAALIPSLLCSRYWWRVRSQRHFVAFTVYCLVLTSWAGMVLALMIWLKLRSEGTSKPVL